jgi:hypothetical protein
MRVHLLLNRGGCPGYNPVAKIPNAKPILPKGQAEPYAPVNVKLRNELLNLFHR